MSSESYHENTDLLSEKTKNMHRAIVSLQEELDAVDWYQQRAEACTDGELRAILLHNKNEEIEHAMMVLEWLRRNDETFAENIGTYVNSSGPILEVEERSTAAEVAGERGAPKSGAPSSVSLGIGSLKAVK